MSYYAKHWLAIAGLVAALWLMTAGQLVIGH